MNRVGKIQTNSCTHASSVCWIKIWIDMYKCQNWAKAGLSLQTCLDLKICPTQAICIIVYLLVSACGNGPSLLAPTGALVVAPLPLFHITSSRSSKSLYNLLTLLKNLEPLCLNIKLPSQLQMNIVADWYADWCWMIVIYADWFWLVLISANLNADWCLLILIDAVWCWLIC